MSIRFKDIKGGTVSIAETIQSLSIDATGARVGRDPETDPANCPKTIKLARTTLDTLEKEAKKHGFDGASTLGREIIEAALSHAEDATRVGMALPDLVDIGIRQFIIVHIAQRRLNHSPKTMMKEE